MSLIGLKKFSLLKRIPPIYKLKDLLDEPMTGIFYEEQMQLVKNKEIIYKIDAVLKRRTRNGVKESFVSWLGYPEKFNKWIASDTIVAATKI